LKNVILGTAGHIDHGKTVLIRALTGVDTDRLKEEKERGISIDLGFALLDLPSGARVGIVDVPGHERFIKNMLAGTCGIDAVLLVVAANEGVMPQTREHLSVVDMLKIDRGIAAVTKIDLVEKEWLDLVMADVEALKRESVLRDAEVIPVSGVTGEGVDRLVEALDRLVATVPERTSKGPARLPIDRVFTVEGFGTVVTGTLWSGEIKAADRLVVLPPGQEVRVRSVQVHSRSVPAALAGQRTAVSLHGQGRVEAARGDMLVTPGAFAPTLMLDTRIDLIADAPRPVKTRARLRLHLGSAEILCRAVLLEGDVLAPGVSQLAQLRLEAPVVAARGDRFVLRYYSPMRVVGGGVVLDPSPSKHKLRDGAVLERMRVLETGTPEDRVLDAIEAAGGGGLAAAEVARQAGLDAGEAGALLAGLSGEGRVEEVRKNLWVTTAVLDSIADKMIEVSRSFQERNPLRWGISKEELRSKLGSGVAAAVFDRVLSRLEAEGRMFQRADRVRSGSVELALSPEREQLRRKVVDLLRGSPFSPPVASDLAQRFPELGSKPTEFLETLVELGDLVKINPTLYLHQDGLREAKRRVSEFLAAHETISVPDFKSLLDTSRKYAIPILEYFDATGFTRRVGDARVAGKKAEP